MIVRILTEGQMRLPDSALDELNQLDDTVLHACTAKDQQAFEVALKTLLDRVRELGEPVPAEELGPSDFVLPMEDATIEEVEAMMNDEGLIPG
jgi:hypothetical protein